jgi:electron transfer flavoprotein beta subunit
MPYNLVVLAKQVPDTENITGEAMKEDGTVNRGALPAIYNPEDLRALELALQLRERYGGEVAVVSMGPPAAAEVLRDSLYRGADRVVLLSDIKFAGADTLATSVVLCEAVRKLGPFDVVLCGSQAIDGDTAQVGPQTADKLGVPQITYVESMELTDRTVKAHRAIPGGYELVHANGPAPRPPAAKRMMRFKKALTRDEAGDGADALEAGGLLLDRWGVDDLGIDPGRCGKKGSPTSVVKIESVVLAKTETKEIEPTDEGIHALLEDLRKEHIL